MALLWMVVHLGLAFGIAAGAKQRIALDADRRDAEIADEVRLGFLDDIRFDDRSPAVWHVGRGAWMIYSLPIGSQAFLLRPDGVVEPLPRRGLARRVHIAEALGVEPDQLDSESRLPPPRLVRRFFLPISLGTWLASALIMYGDPGPTTALSFVVGVVAPAALCAAVLWWLRVLERCSDAAPRLPEHWRRNSVSYV